MNFIISYILLYISPVLTSLITRNDVASFSNFLLCVVPIICVIPSSYAYFLIKNKENEHIVKHAWYTACFLLGAITIRWEHVVSHVNDLPILNFVVFFALGALSLLSFTISHIAEKFDSSVRTHYGDVTILPLTLVSIAMFYNSVPDDVFFLSRTAPIIIVVVVAWTTIFLIAFLEFAKHGTTRYKQKGFALVSISATVISAIFLILLECQASPIYFLVYAFLSGFYMQSHRKYDSDMRFHKNSFLVALLIFSISLISAAVKFVTFRHTVGFWTGVAIIFVPSIILAEILRFTHGNRWPFLSAAIVSLCTLAVFDKTNRDEHFILYILWVVGSHFVIALVSSLLLTYEQKPSKLPHPPHVYDPKLFLKRTRFHYCYDVLSSGVPFAMCARTFSAHDSNWLKNTFKDDKPGKMQGLWHMQDVTTSSYLIHVKHNKKDDNEIFNVQIAKKPDFTALFCLLFVEYETVKRTDQWYETFVYLNFCGFTIHLDTLWCYQESSSSLIRLQYNKKGDVTYQYRLKKIAHLDQKNNVVKTDQFTNVMKLLHGKPYFWS